MGHSILREAEYDELSKVELNGAILDVGGSKKSGYNKKVKGQNSWHVVNLDENCEPDTFVDLEKKFPFENGSFDHVVCLNVLEHLFEFENAFRESLRCIKVGGKIVIATPFVHHIHGSPDDYLRYTKSAFFKLSEKYDCKLIYIKPLGYGLFSLIFQTAGGVIRINFLKEFFKSISINLDKVLLKIVKKYSKLTQTIPLGYFVIFEKTSN